MLMHRSKRRPRARLLVECLESRTLLSTLFLDTEANDTLTQAQLLAELTPYAPVEVRGRITAATAADVDWFRVDVPLTSSVALTLGGLAGRPFAGVLSLYNDDPASGDPAV